MTSNPFEGRRESPAPTNSPMRPGDVRTIMVRDKDTKEVVRTLTLRRTHREYVHDLCDAYNAGRETDVVRWFVTDNGELKLAHRAL